MPTNRPDYYAEHRVRIRRQCLCRCGNLGWVAMTEEERERYGHHKPVSEREGVSPRVYIGKRAALTRQANKLLNAQRAFTPEHNSR